ncbi:MAG: hypothetical protein HYX38_26040 [Rhodospirillales bacterium]|nr:hypothetical protein [Rhodospirillales bacterium]
MVLCATARWILVLGVAAFAAACTDPSKVPGPDRSSDTNATMITWTDGKPAIQITCGMPGGCQNRALAMCKGNYTTLNMDNMLTRGDASVVRGTGTVVVRCAGV